MKRKLVGRVFKLVILLVWIWNSGAIADNRDRTLIKCSSERKFDSPELLIEVENVSGGRALSIHYFQRNRNESLAEIIATQVGLAPNSYKNFWITGSILPDGLAFTEHLADISNLNFDYPLGRGGVLLHFFGYPTTPSNRFFVDPRLVGSHVSFRKVHFADANAFQWEFSIQGGRVWEPGSFVDLLRDFSQPITALESEKMTAPFQAVLHFAEDECVLETPNCARLLAGETQ